MFSITTEVSYGKKKLAVVHVCYVEFVRFKINYFLIMIFNSHTVWNLHLKL